MERSQSFVLGSLMIIMLSGWVIPVPAQNRPEDGKMIRQRMLSDIRSMKDQLNELNQVVNRLRKKLGRLENQNQKQKNQIRKLQRQLENNQEPPETSDDTQESTAGRSERSDESSVWVSQSNVDYRIRREPLDREETYVTTDDTVLTELAHKYYRDASYWRRIYEVNKDKLPAPDVVPPNVNLRLPPIDELQAP